jgi:uncharacterized protein (TIGR03086 family)
MNPIDQLTHILQALTTTVDEISPMQMNDATPCSEFTVHDVLDHMIVLGASFSYWFRGEEAPDLKAPAVYGWVPAAEFREVMTDLLAAVSAPGALERVVSTPMGDMPGDTFARLVAVDGLIHGWDLATATGRTFEVPADVIAAVDEFARQALDPDIRSTDQFHAPVTPIAGASPLERLVAFSGRAA